MRWGLWPRPTREALARARHGADNPTDMPTYLLLVLSGLLATVPAQSPQVVVSRIDGSVLSGEMVRVTEAAVELRVANEVVTIARVDVLALHGTVPRPGATVTARLVGGDEVRGELRGGDTGGESLMIESRSLGNVTLATDRLLALVVHKVAGDADASEFVLPAEGGHDEAIFLPAKRGFDTLFGAIHCFTNDGVLFAATSSATPRSYSLDQIAAVALRGSRAAAGTATALLITRGGDAIAVDVVRADGAALELADDRSRPFTLAWSEVATLLFRGNDRVFLSELEPDAVEQGSALIGENAVLYPWRRDRNVRGGFLVVGGRTYARGLGVHSHCVLTFVVPAGYDTFCVAVGIDDEVRALPARGNVDVAVLVDGQVVAELTRVRIGAEAQNLGRLSVRGGSKLTLRVDFGLGLDFGDRVDWLHAVLLRKRT